MQNKIVRCGSRDEDCNKKCLHYKDHKKYIACDVSSRCTKKQAAFMKKNKNCHECLEAAGCVQYPNMDNVNFIDLTTDPENCRMYRRLVVYTDCCK